ncbi:MAG: hypothetical protein KDB62_03010 [Solirubrobacterales bacterium]|jgi:hypothetical protein|nr:hypothetical protein [Solirubrobacterales bacterium]
MFYNLVGRIVVKFAWFYLRRKVALRTVAVTGAGLAVGITAIGVAGYLATREVPEA